MSAKRKSDWMRFFEKSKTIPYSYDLLKAAWDAGRRAERRKSSHTVKSNNSKLPDDLPLIHWAGTPAGVCERKDSGKDRRHTKLPGKCSVTHLAECNFHLNITCPICRRFESQRRKTLKKGER